MAPPTATNNKRSPSLPPSLLTNPLNSALPSVCSHSCVPMLFQRPLRTSEPCALVKRALAAQASPSTSRAPPSTESSNNSCAKVAISLLATVLAARASTELSLKMKTSSSSTLAQECCPWPMQAPIPMDHNSSCALLKLPGWMASMLCLAM